jgi:protoheme IX farnesyltransferase
MAVYWMYKSVKSYQNDDDRAYAKTVFRLSIIVVTVISLTIG